MRWPATLILKRKSALRPSTVRCSTGLNALFHRPGLRPQYYETGTRIDGNNLPHTARSQADPESFQPDVVLVHGDTTTTMATSPAAFTSVFPSAMLRRACVPATFIRRGQKRPTVRLPAIWQCTILPLPRTRVRTCCAKISPTTKFCDRQYGHRCVDLGTRSRHGKQRSAESARSPLSIPE